MYDLLNMHTKPGMHNDDYYDIANSSLCVIIVSVQAIAIYILLNYIIIIVTIFN